MARNCMKWNRRLTSWLMHSFTSASCSTPSIFLVLTIAKWISQRTKKRTSEFSHRLWLIEMPFVLIYALFAHSNYNCKFCLDIRCARAHIVSINADTVTLFLPLWIHFFPYEIRSIFDFLNAAFIIHFFLFLSLSLASLPLCLCLHILFLLLRVLFFFICFHNDLLRNLSQNGAAPTCLHRNTLRPIHPAHAHIRSQCTAKSKEHEQNCTHDYQWVWF